MNKWQAQTYIGQVAASNQFFVKQHCMKRQWIKSTYLTKCTDNLFCFNGSMTTCFSGELMKRGSTKRQGVEQAAHREQASLHACQHQLEHQHVRANSCNKQLYCSCYALKIYKKQLFTILCFMALTFDVYKNRISLPVPYIEIRIFTI